MNKDNPPVFHADRCGIRSDGETLYLVFEGKSDWNKDHILHVGFSREGAEKLIGLIRSVFA